jgi:hypothetical protein
MLGYVKTMSASGPETERQDVVYRVPSKCWELSIGNIGTKLGSIDDLSATCRVLLNIRVADERVVLPV